MAGTYLLGSLKFNYRLAIGIFNIVICFCLYAIKAKIAIAVFVGAIPGALPPLIGYVAAHGKIDKIALILFGIQFVWQFPHFWAIAWVLDDDYKLAGFRLLPSEKANNLTSAVTICFYFDFGAGKFAANLLWVMAVIMWAGYRWYLQFDIFIPHLYCCARWKLKRQKS